MWRYTFTKEIIYKIERFIKFELYIKLGGNMEITLFGNLFFIQVCLFVLYFGFNIILPIWLLLLPLIIVGTILIFILLLLLFAFIVTYING